MHGKTELALESAVLACQGTGAERAGKPPPPTRPPCCHHNKGHDGHQGEWGFTVESPGVAGSGGPRGELSPCTLCQARDSKWVQAGWSPVPHGPQGCSRGVAAPRTHRSRLVPNPSMVPDHT